MLVALMGLIGLLFGSFANVCVHRIPLGESVAFPASHCPHCQANIAWFDNIPVLSWCMLAGRCRQCHASIALRYPLLESAMGLSWAGLAMFYGDGFPLLHATVLVSLLWVLSWIDMETGFLPDILTLPGILIGCLLSWWQGNGADAVIGVIVGYGFFWLVAKAFLYITGREGMGYGDFKLLAMLGAFLGWSALPFVVFVSSLLGAVVGSALLLLRGTSLRVEIPFGPYLAMAGVIWLLLGTQLLNIYLEWAVSAS